MATEKKTYSIGVDIGGTKMNAVLFDGTNVVADYCLTTPKDSFSHFMVMLKALIDPLQEKAEELKVKVSGIGLGVAGVLDSSRRVMLKSPNISIIDGVSLADELEKVVNIPVQMDNDSNCFLLSELRNGVAQKSTNTLGVILGTGVGGAWYVNDSFYNGFRGGAMEPGRMIIDKNSSFDFEQEYQKIIQGNGLDLASRAYKGEVLAIKAYEDFGEILGIALANMVNLIDPELIVLGGSVVNSADLFLPSAKKTMRAHIMSKESKKIKVLPFKTGEFAGAIGASLLVE